MAKKLRKALNEDTHFIKRGKFEMPTAKIYLIIAIVVFHILPLAFVFMGETGMSVLFNMFLYTLNVMAIFAIGLIYGIRVGYNFKFPLVLTVLSVLSFVFYYNSEYIFETPENYIMTGIITLIVYTVFSFVSTAAGGWLKRFFV